MNAVAIPVRLLDPAEAALARLQDRVTTLEVALLRCINLCNKATYTLSGVRLSTMQIGNIVALDATTLDKWRTAIAAAKQQTV